MGKLKEYIRILCIGDQHVKTSNIPQINIFLEKLKSFLDKSVLDDSCPDIIISMGDLLDTHEKLHSMALNKAIEYLDLLRSYTTTYVLVGNHDAYNNSMFLSTNHWLNCLKKYDNLTVIDKVTVIDVPTLSSSIKITLCPYVPDGKFKDALATREGEWEDSTCIFAHQLFDGAKMGAIVAENVEKWDEKSPDVVSGHIHDKQKVQSNLYYTGSSMQHAFGESHDKTLLLATLYTDDKPINYKEIDLNLPKKKIVYMEMEDLEEFDISSLDPSVEYKLTVDGNYEEFEGFKKTAKYKKIIKQGIKIVFKHKRSFILDKKEKLKENINRGSEGGPDTKPQQRSFKEILEELIIAENNPFFNDLLHTIVLDRYIGKENEDDIIIIDEEE